MLPAILFPWTAAPPPPFNFKRKIYKMPVRIHECPMHMMLYTATKMPFIYSFSRNCAASVPISHIHISASDLYIPRISPHISWRRIDRSIVGINKLLTDTGMWKLALWTCNSFLWIYCIFLFRNICCEFSVLILCSVSYWLLYLYIFKAFTSEAFLF